MKTVLSLGAGIQSTAVLLKAVHGELPLPDYAVFADTGWERRATYQHLAELALVCEKAGIKMTALTGRNIREDSLGVAVRGRRSSGRLYVPLPYMTVAPDGSIGMLRRMCTQEYKIAPIEKYIRREVLGLKPRQRAPKTPAVEVWFGISADEIARIRTPRHKFIVNYYPLIGLKSARDGSNEWVSEERLTRSDCVSWLRKHNYAIPARSACIGCPYHSNTEWREIRNTSSEEWADAVEFDRAIRDTGGARGKLYLHQSGRPLEDADLDGPAGQMNLWGDECEGMCGV